MSVITYPLNGVTYDATDAETYLCTRSSGVYAESGNFAASCTGEDRVVTIGTGLAWINDGNFTGKSICSTEETELKLSISNTSLSRYDRIVLRFDRTTEPYTSYFTVIEGTAASSPTAPAIVRDEYYYDLGLYLVYRGAGTTVVQAADITTTLADTDVCGIMSDAVTNSTPATIQAQYESLLARYESLRARLQTAIEETEAGADWLMATSNIQSEEIETILDDGEHSTTNHYLDAQGLQQVWTAIKTELDAVAEALEDL